MIARRSTPLVYFFFFFFLLYPSPPPELPPPPLPPPPLPLPTKFDAIGSGPCREFSVRATALLNMASDGMILTNHDHQIRVGVLTGKRRNVHRPFHLSLMFLWIHFRRLSARFFIRVGWLCLAAAAALSLSLIFFQPLEGDADLKPGLGVFFPPLSSLTGMHDNQC